MVLGPTISTQPTSVVVTVIQMLLLIVRELVEDQLHINGAFLASADIKVFWLHIPIYNATSDWPCTFCTPRVFLFSISLLFGSINTCYYLYVGHNIVK